MIWDTDDYNALLTFQLAAQQVCGIGVQGGTEYVVGNELRHDNGESLPGLSACGNLGDVFQQRFEEEAVGRVQHDHAGALSPKFPFFSHLFCFCRFDSDMDSRYIV